MMPAENKLRLKTIDAMRGVAALWVLLHHAVAYVEMPLQAGVLGSVPPGVADSVPAQSLLAPGSSLSQGNRWVKALVWPCNWGFLGVPMFFVISGFCIHLPVGRVRGSGCDHEFSYWNYWMRRFWRLYPTHVAAVIGSIGLVSLTHLVLLYCGLGPIAPIPWRVLAAHFAMVQAQLPSTADYVWYYNANLWSLETELQLYAAYLC